MRHWFRILVWVGWTRPRMDLKEGKQLQKKTTARSGAFLTKYSRFWNIHGNMEFGGGGHHPTIGAAYPIVGDWHPDWKRHPATIVLHGWGKTTHRRISHTNFAAFPHLETLILKLLCLCRHTCYLLKSAGSFSGLWCWQLFHTPLQLPSLLACCRFLRPWALRADHQPATNSVKWRCWDACQLSCPFAVLKRIGLLFCKCNCAHLKEQCLQQKWPGLQSAFPGGRILAIWSVVASHFGSLQFNTRSKHKKHSLNIVPAWYLMKESNNLNFQLFLFPKSQVSLFLVLRA